MSDETREVGLLEIDFTSIGLNPVIASSLDDTQLAGILDAGLKSGLIDRGEHTNLDGATLATHYKAKLASDLLKTRQASGVKAFDVKMQETQSEIELVIDKAISECFNAEQSVLLDNDFPYSKCDNHLHF